MYVCATMMHLRKDIINWLTDAKKYIIFSTFYRQNGLSKSIAHVHKKLQPTAGDFPTPLTIRPPIYQ